MLRVQSKEMAKRLGCEGAERISAGRPGLAMTNRWGPMQTYFLDKGMLVDERVSPQEIGQMDEQTAAILTSALQASGRVTLANIMQWCGLGQRQARELQERLAVQGWIRKDAKQANAYCITQKTQEILTNRLTRQTPTNPTNPTKTPTNRPQPLFSTGG
jgi:predicted transcriptional regulator